MRIKLCGDPWDLFKFNALYLFYLLVVELNKCFLVAVHCVADRNRDQCLVPAAYSAALKFKPGP